MVDFVEKLWQQKDIEQCKSYLWSHPYSLILTLFHGRMWYHTWISELLIVKNLLESKLRYYMQFWGPKYIFTQSIYSSWWGFMIYGQDCCQEREIKNLSNEATFEMGKKKYRPRDWE